MTLANYSELQAEAVDFMTRQGQSGKAATWIKLGEARLNRELGPVQVDASLTGTVSSRAIDVSALSIVRPVEMYLAEVGLDEVRMIPGVHEYLNSAGRPTHWELEDASINFDRPLSGAYPFRFRYQGRFALSDDSPTNWLLDEHPDIYLAATLMWGAGYNEEWPNGAAWKTMLDEGIASVKNVLAKGRKAELRVDPALSPRRGYSLAQWANDG